MKKKRNEKLKVRIRFNENITKEESQRRWFDFFDFILTEKAEDKKLKPKMNKDGRY